MVVSKMEPKIMLVASKTLICKTAQNKMVANKMMRLAYPKQVMRMMVASKMEVSKKVLTI